MAQYPTAFHRYLCETLRHLSFACVSVTLIAAVTRIWAEQLVSAEILSKIFYTTVVVLGASFITRLIYEEKNEPENKKPARSSKSSSQR